ncbi:MAG: AAA family ATPase, partial [Synechococcaceae cyanobacterium]
MGNSNSWVIDHESAHHFLVLLGKDPATTRLRAFPHRDDPRRREIGARKGVWNLRQAERWARDGRGLYVVINDGGDRNSAIQRCRALFVEWDDRPIAWQRQAWRELDLPEPSVIVASGGRSLHCYWVLREPLAPAAWRPLQRELIEKAQGDRSCGDPARVMRLPGSWYLDGQGQPVARVTIAAASGHRYGAQELAAALEACRELAPFGLEAAGLAGFEGSPASTGLAPSGLAPSGLAPSVAAATAPIALLPPADPETPPTGHSAAAQPAKATPSPAQNAPRTDPPADPEQLWHDICNALAAIPPRVAGSNSYATYRNILWGLISACQEAGRGQEEAIALMEAHSPSAESGWDVRQVANSGGRQISAATFWFHARRHGWRPEGQEGGSSASLAAAGPPWPPHPPSARRSPLASPAPGGGSASVGSTVGHSPSTGPSPRRGPVHLPLARRLDALEHCIQALLGREPNSLRRHARVRQAQAALDLKALLRHQEIGQLILEAHDQRHGNRFHPLASSQRLTMTVPQLSWEIPQCLPSRDLTILGGRAKVGKTRLAHALLRCLLCAEDFLGFGAPPAPRPVILISDDQADGDTAQMLQESGMWGHPQLLWSRRFRATEANLEALRGCLAEQSGAVVMLDSLRSITRSCCFGENDPEMGSLIYDLKHQITDAGGTVLLVHHCN